MGIIHAMRALPPFHPSWLQLLTLFALYLFVSADLFSPLFFFSYLVKFSESMKRHVSCTQCMV